MLYTDHHYSDNFCSQTMAELAAHIDAGVSCNLVAMPGVGVTYFLRALVQKQSADFVFINSYEMQEFSRQAFYEQLARKLDLEESEASDLSKISDALRERTVNTGRIILVCNRLDRLSDILDQNFYDNLRYIRDSARVNITMIFVSSQPMADLSAHPIKDILSLVNQTVYFPGYDDNDLREIFAFSGNQELETDALVHAGGHHLLLQILHRCQDLNNPLSDPMVELVVKDLYLGLNAKRRKQLDAAATKGTKPTDPYLIGAGFIKETANGYLPFTDLLMTYIQSANKQHLPLKEKRLLRLLGDHKGKIVSKQIISDYVWPEQDGIVTDWALNALVYRLRRHSAFNSERYSIESRKGQGYILIDHS